MVKEKTIYVRNYDDDGDDGDDDDDNDVDDECNDRIRTLTFFISLSNTSNLFAASFMTILF